MQIEEELTEFVPQRETVLTIGVFDGVHVGHRHLIEYVKRQALLRDYLAGVVTFRQHPLQVLALQSHVPRLTSVQDRISLLRGLGVDFVTPLSFTPEVAQLPARDFVTLLRKHLKMRGLVVGPDFALGRGREGDVFALRSLGKELGFWVDVVSPKLVNGEVASSTTIRQALARGDMLKVQRLLGRPYALSGHVRHGVERGRQLGFPTANLEVNSDQSLPADGVYATRAHLGKRTYSSVTNIGTRPTFGQGERTVEVYLLGFEGELYGHELQVELVQHLRAEKRFPNPEELAAQVGRDVEEARSILEEANE